MPEDYLNNIDKTKSKIYYLITSEVNALERLNLLKDYDNPKDYTYYETDEENLKKCESIVEISKYIKEKCIECNLKYYDTIRNREEKFDEIIEDIINN